MHLDSDTFDEALRTSDREKLPVADILIASKAITKEQRDAVLVEQVRRRVHYTFTFSPDGQFTFQERSPASREPSLTVDVLQRRLSQSHGSNRNKKRGKHGKRVKRGKHGKPRQPS